MVRRFMLKTETAQRNKTINGKKYAFDEYGAMVAEWSLDEERSARQEPCLLL